jgi:DNA primase
LDFIEQLKSSVDIVHVVGEYVRLKKAGAGPRWVGLCPFHSEKTASFGVHSTHQFYKCFGCGAGGDVIKFVEEIERLTFWEAVKYLAEKHGIPLPKRTDLTDQEAKERAGLFEAQEAAAKAYRDLLFSPAGQEARAYLVRRGVSQATAEEFGLGLADRGGQMMVRILERLRLDGEQMEASGLVLRRQDGSGFFDRFRGRLMFPIHSESAKIIGFGGRALAAGDEPKYLNSPETSIYQKSRVLYNLNRARKVMQEAGSSILVEGYMDVIGVYAAGVKNVVATCGTSLTNYQARSLRRHAGQLVVNFDPDQAGMNATERSIPILLEEGMHLKVLELEGGLDPDEYIKERGVAAYQEVLSGARGYFHWLADRARSRFDMKTPEGRVAAFQFLLPSIQKMPDRLERLAVAGDVAEYLRMEKGVVLEEFKRAARDRRGQVQAKKEEASQDPTELLLINALLTNAEAREVLAEALRRPGATARFAAQRIFDTILRMIDAGEPVHFRSVDARLEENDRALLARLVFADETIQSEVSTEQALACLKRLESGEHQGARGRLRAEIRDAEREGRMEDALRLMRQLTALERS